MAKSEDNFFNAGKRFDKEGLIRWFTVLPTLQTHYRKPMEYSEEALENAKLGLDHLYSQVRELLDPTYHLISGMTVPIHEFRADVKSKSEFLKSD